VRIFGRRDERQEDDEYSQKARSRGCIDLIDDEIERRERKGVIYTTVRLLDPQSSTDS
jgi:hypothetical protein